MSVFFKGKNLGRINNDAFESVEHCMRQMEKIRLNRETSAAIQVIREKLAKNEISVDEARSQVKAVEVEYWRKLKILEAVSGGKVSILLTHVNLFFVSPFNASSA